MGYGSIARPKTAKQVKTYRDKKLKGAVKAGKVTGKQVQALTQVSKSERAGHKMVKARPPKMKSIMKRAGEYFFPKVAAATRKKEETIKKVSGR